MNPLRMLGRLPLALVCLLGCSRGAPAAPPAAPSVGLEDSGPRHAFGDAPETGPISEMVVCGGSKELHFENRTFEVEKGPALMVGGSCDVTLTGCKVIAMHTDGIGAVSANAQSHLRLQETTIQGDVGLFVAGTARVEIEGGSIAGAGSAVNVAGESTTRIYGAAVMGEVARTGQATVERL